MIDGKTFPVCLKPEEIADFKDSLKKLLDAAPAGKARAGLESFCAKFNERMEDRGANK